MQTLVTESHVLEVHWPDFKFAGNGETLITHNVQSCIVGALTNGSTRGMFHIPTYSLEADSRYCHKHLDDFVIQIISIFDGGSSLLLAGGWSENSEDLVHALQLMALQLRYDLEHSYDLFGDRINRTVTYLPDGLVVVNSSQLETTAEGLCNRIPVSSRTYQL